MDQWLDKILTLGDAIPSYDDVSVNSTEIIVLVHGNNVYGDPIYCYLKIPYGIYDEVKAIINGPGNFDPRDYGIVVASGFGRPTEEVKVRIGLEHGIIAVEL